MARMTKERGTNKQRGFWRLVHFPVKLSDRNYGEGEALSTGNKGNGDGTWKRK